MNKMSTTIQWKTEKRRVSSLFPAAYNPRKISEKGKADLVASVDRFGRVEPIAINTDGTVIGGHQRLAIYVEKGLKDVEVVVPSRKLTKKEEKELNLRLNKNLGEWDWSKLGMFGEELLLDIGFDSGELMVGLGLSGEGDVDVDDSRMEVLTVLPPESPQIRERAQIHCETIEQYRQLKSLVDLGEITAERILKVFSKKT
jgi:ParB-like chromosome segregation protein Spo0J